MAKYIIIKTDEQTFEDHIVTQYPVIGTADEFVVPYECFFTDNEVQNDIVADEMYELNLHIIRIVGV